MEHVSLGWLVFEMTDSAFMVGVSAAARMAPMFFLGIFSGAVADRVDRRVFLRFVNLTGAFAATAVAIVLITDAAKVWHLMLFAVVSGSIGAFNITVGQAYTYDLVGPKRALNGMSLNGLGRQIGGVVGSVIAGLVIAGVSAGVQYLAVGGSYLAGLAVLLFIKEVGHASVGRRESIKSNLIGYIGILRKNGTLRTLMVLTAATEVFGFAHMSLLPVFAKEELAVGAVGLGFMTAVRQAGGTLGLLLMAGMGDYRRKGMLTFVIVGGFGVGQMLFAVASDLLVFLVVLAFVNACAFAVDALYKTLMQSNVADEERGRAMGSWAFSVGTAPVGHLGVGTMASYFGAPVALLINGGILTTIAIGTAVGLPKIRRLE